MSSNSAVMDPWQADTSDVAWIELGDAASTPRRTTVYSSQESMRFGVRIYSDAQAESIERVVQSREALPEPPLPLDD
jgi:hypothetical protein